LERNNILKIKNLHISYGPVKAIRGVSLEVYESEIVVLIGANGAGKTTLLESILNINPSREGNICFLEEDITHKKTEHIVASGISLIPEGRGILPLMTVMENLQLGAYHFKGNINKSLDRVYKLFPVLRKRSKQMAGTLSGGEQQMLSLARGLMSAPKLLMLDEPSLGLAPVVVNELFRILEVLNKSGYTILLSEQNARIALELGDRGYVFETGNIVMSGDTKELQNNPRVKEAYLGV